MTKKVGLLVMAFGTPSSYEGIEDYYTRIRHGHKPSTEQLQELTNRFKMIGLSPLIELTIAQADELYKQVNEVQSEVEFELYLGFQHVAPFIGDKVREMHENGIREVVAVAMAPHYSAFSVKGYHDAAYEVAKEYPDMHFTDIMEWWKEEKFSDFWANNIKEEFSKIPEEDHDKTVVILSAHSLPEKLMAIEDTYKHQVADSAAEIIKKADLKHAVQAWQSEGATADTWLGPDVQDVTRDLYQAHGYTHFIYCPFGFVTEHLEVFFDNDYECKIVCDELGVNYHRPGMPNANPTFVGSITDLIMKKLELN
ncbi:ferrochelatase [Lactococcus allomyrinae]|uniref:Coproporphyrin III ferrochelatase n=2 Tax=Lactococcus allomyrinae TaxID=2419773 RepID=A0A387BGJ2_9LACT|nr:ferrochelatase [Lactococcus allomyrinae]